MNEKACSHGKIAATRDERNTCCFKLMNLTPEVSLESKEIRYRLPGLAYGDIGRGGQCVFHNPTCSARTHQQYLSGPQNIISDGPLNKKLFVSVICTHFCTRAR